MRAIERERERERERESIQHFVTKKMNFCKNERCLIRTQAL